MSIQAKVIRADGVSIEASGDDVANVIGVLICLDSWGKQDSRQHFTEEQIDEIARRLDARFAAGLADALDCTYKSYQSLKEGTDD